MARVILVLVIAAILEVGGDALVRRGLDASSALPILAGALALAVYGIMVNQSGVDFSRMMGIYIAIFFLTSQIIAFAAFRITPAPKTLIGGTLIVIGGFVVLV